MKPLIDKAKLMQELVDSYDLEGGEKISAIKLYSLVRAQPIVQTEVAYWLPSMDGDEVYCSECGKDIDLWSFRDYPYCPWCGSIMVNFDETEHDEKGYTRYRK